MYEMYTKLVWRDEETNIALFKITGTKEHKFGYRLTILDSDRIMSDVTTTLIDVWANEFTTVHNSRTGLSKLCKTHKNVEKELQRIRDNGIVFSLETEMKLVKGKLNADR